MDAQHMDVLFAMHKGIPRQSLKAIDDEKIRARLFKCTPLAPSPPKACSPSQKHCGQLQQSLKFEFLDTQY
jgi:hypothetical protein